MAKSAGIDPDFLLGAKTGYTLEGGLCISFLTNVNQATYLVVLGNAGTAYESCQNMIDAYHVYQYLKDHYALETLYHSGERIAQTEVKYGKEAATELCAHEEIRLLLADGEYRKEVELNDAPLIAPINCEEPLGELHVLDAAGNLRESYPLYAKTAIARDWFAYVMQAWLLFVAVLMLAVYFLYWRYGSALRHRFGVRHRVAVAKQVGQKGQTKINELASSLIKAADQESEAHSKEQANRRSADTHARTRPPLPIPSDKNSDKQSESKCINKQQDQSAKANEADIIDHVTKATQMKKANQANKAKKANQTKKAQKGNKAKKVTNNNKTGKTNRKQKSRQTKGKQKANIQLKTYKPKKKG